jgi:hypothetical protein
MLMGFQSEKSMLLFGSIMFMISFYWSGEALVHDMSRKCATPTSPLVLEFGLIGYGIAGLATHDEESIG